MEAMTHMLLFATMLAGCGGNTAAPPRDAGSCTGDQDCAAPTAVCDLAGTMTCVQCTPAEATACSGATPACIGNTCQKCTAHTQCAVSNVCLPDGTCADAAQVAYVQAGGTGSLPCTKAAPCGTLDDGVRANKPTVKVAAGTLADNKVTTIDGKALTIVADPGAKLSRGNSGIILEVRNDGADVAVYDLEITAGAGAANAAISVPNGGAPKLSLTRVAVDGNQGTGISVAAGKLTIARSTISGNTGGGLSISSAQFDITNTFIVSNGGGLATFGGVAIGSIAVSASGQHRLAFNTVTANLGPATVNTGITCSSVLSPLVFSNNIVYGNIVSGGGAQIGGSANCTATYSDIGPDGLAGVGNINADPLFVNVAQANFHIQATSPARDAADPAATLAVDFDGDMRPQGTRSDMGADEWKQP
jgi:Right handed beta helix region